MKMVSPCSARCGRSIQVVSFGFGVKIHLSFCGLTRLLGEKTRFLPAEPVSVPPKSDTNRFPIEFWPIWVRFSGPTIGGSSPLRRFVPVFAEISVTEQKPGENRRGTPTKSVPFDSPSNLGCTGTIFGGIGPIPIHSAPKYRFWRGKFGRFWS